MITQRVWFDIQGIENLIQEPIPRGYNLLISGVDGSGRTSLALALAKARLDARDLIAYVTIDESPVSIQLLMEEEFNLPVKGLLEKKQLTIIDSWSGQGQIEDWVVIDPLSPAILDYTTDLWIKQNLPNAYLMVFDSLSTIFDYAKLEEALQFLRYKTRKIRATEGIGIFTVSETAHSAELLTILSGYFDGILTTGLNLVDDEYVYTVQATKMRRVSTSRKTRLVKRSKDQLIIQ